MFFYFSCFGNLYPFSWMLSYTFRKVTWKFFLLLNVLYINFLSIDFQELLEVREIIETKGGAYDCIVCKKSCNSLAQVATHLKGEPHLKQCR